MNILKLGVMVALAYFAIAARKDDMEVSIKDSSGKQLMAIGAVTDGKPIPKNSVSLSYFCGFFIDQQGRSMYLDVFKGVFIWYKNLEAYNFELGEKGDGYIILDYKGQFINDIVTVEKNGIAIASQDEPMKKQYFKKLK